MQGFRKEPSPERERLFRLYQKSREPMTRLAARILGAGPQAEDAVHESFVKLLRVYDQLRERSDGQLERWLAVVARNTALDILRKERRETPLEREAWEPSIPADEGGFEALVALIRAMPEDYRRVLELRFVAEWSLADIAKELHLTEGAVKTRIFRGRRLLIRQLREEGYLDGQACV